MNIIETAELLRSGAFARRSSWAKGKHCGIDANGLYIKMGPFEMSPQMHFAIGIDDLLADDWELYIPRNITRSMRPTFRPVSGRPDRPSFPTLKEISIPPPKNTTRPTAKTKKVKTPLTLKKE